MFKFTGFDIRHRSFNFFLSAEHFDPKSVSEINTDKGDSQKPFSRSAIFSISKGTIGTTVRLFSDPTNKVRNQ